MAKDEAPKVPVQEKLFLSRRRLHDSLPLLDILVGCWVLTCQTAGPRGRGSSDLTCTDFSFHQK